MYNYHYDYQLMQNLYVPQYFEWSAQSYYVPLIQIPLATKI
jgi:hypothetical protein